MRSMFAVKEHGMPKLSLGVAYITAAFLGLASIAHANTLDLSTAVLAGGASFNGGKILFDANTAGETATFTLPSVVGTQYQITVTGHNDQSASFFDFTIDPTGLGTDYMVLQNDVNFGGNGAITLPTFTDLATSDLLQITNGGTGNSEGQIREIDSITIDPVATPLPMTLPLFATGIGAMGLLGWRRKRKAQAGA